jgi:hypothetical protein
MQKMKGFRKFILMTSLGLISICIVILAASVISNLNLPERSAVVEHLSELDKIRLEEMLHLRQSVGNDVWPGWGDIDISAIQYNEEYVFLVGYSKPPNGWVNVSTNQLLGGPWEVVPEDVFSDQIYYRQYLPAPDVTPQAFTVRVGDRWVSSIGTYDWMRISLTQTVRQDLPAFLRPVFPSKLFVDQLLGGGDKYISLSAHEAFHAYEGISAPEKLEKAETAGRQLEDQYPWEDETLKADWQEELNILAEALRSTDQGMTVDLARQFLLLRTARRESASLSPELIAYENQREWVEGLARYAELEIWRRASNGTYTPLPDTSLLSDYDGYTGYDRRWSQELGQLTMMAEDRGDGRFYYTGMAQAFLLDKLMLEWKLQAFEEDVWLDELLEIAVSK